jgi:hypothetical protein
VLSSKSLNICFYKKLIEHKYLFVLYTKHFVCITVIYYFVVHTIEGLMKQNNMKTCLLFGARPYMENLTPKRFIIGLSTVYSLSVAIVYIIISLFFENACDA